MKLNKIIDNYVVSDQIQIEDVAVIKSNGFKVIFCNRPDGEDINQVTVKSIQEQAKQLGLSFIHQPVIGGQITQQDIETFKAHYAASEKPIFAYCRTGTRSSMLWALSESSERPTDEIINLTAAAGYNLSHLFKK